MREIHGGQEGGGQRGRREKRGILFPGSRRCNVEGKVESVGYDVKERRVGAKNGGA